MDVIHSLSAAVNQPITCVDMHTCGEPTRIVVKGYPTLTGTLLEQRSQAKSKHDHIRRKLMLEPRGHYDMYGAILRTETELTMKNQADIGVLFMTNDGYSTMCGHATIALGRFLIDTHDLNVFPNRQNVTYDVDSSTSRLRLHAPCGVVSVVIPTLEDGRRSDPSKPVSFTSVESFATGLDVKVSMPEGYLFPKGFSVKVDFAYGGAFYCLVRAADLPGLNHGLENIDMDTANQLTKQLKRTINNNPEMAKYFCHPLEQDLSFLYSVILVDDKLGSPLPDTLGSEAGLCFFADQQVDRSPTGSAVSARLAAAYARKTLRSGDSWTYHSIVSMEKAEKAAFTGLVLDEVSTASSTDYPVIKTQVQGYASYTGYHTFIAEPSDVLGNDGFNMKKLCG